MLNSTFFNKLRHIPITLALPGKERLQMFRNDAIRVHVDVQINTRLCTHAQTRADKHDALHLDTALCK